MKRPGRHYGVSQGRKAPASGKCEPNRPGAGFRQFQTTIPASPPSRWPSISACLIVKNEAANIRPCLSSLEDLASEVIVVDTGSTDDTVEIARGMGAKVSRFEWVDDFAAARNESIGRATGEWIFWLDADDRLSPRTVAQLKAAAASGIADAYGCLVASRTDASAEEVTEHVRLFKNGMGILFSGPIHESVATSVVSKGLRFARTNVVVEHTGYESREAKRRRGIRNLPIIERQIALHPEQVDLVFYRGQARGLQNDADGLEADMQQFLSLTRPREPFDFKRFWAYVSLAGVLERQGHLDRLEDLIGKALAEFPGHPAFLVLQSQIQMATGSPEAAIESLQTARRPIQSPVRGLRPRDSVVERHLAEAYRALGRLNEAVHWAEQAREHDLASAPTAYFLAKLYSEVNRLEEAEKVLEPHLSSATVPEPWLIVAEVRAEQRRWAEALSALEEARHLGLAEETYRTLLARLKTAEAKSAGEAQDATPAAKLKAAGIASLRMGDHLKAAESFAAAVQASPTDPDSYRYLAAALNALGQEEQALEAWRLAAAVR